MSIHVEMPARADFSDEQLAFIREMGISYLNLNISLEECREDFLLPLVKRLEGYGLKISDLACPPLQKNADIILGRAGRDRAIARFQELVRMAGQLGVPLVSLAWQPNGIFRSGRRPGRYTRGGTAFYADQEEILARPIANDRVYGPEEIWDNFAYFLERLIPVCETARVRMALHPHGPPLPSLGGAASLIYTADDYRRALALAGRSQALAVKLCVGCVLENPQFGDLMACVREFCGKGQLAEVHLRNVSGPLPYFEETLWEDGYGDLYGVLKQLIVCGFQGYLSIDHAFQGYASTGGSLGSMAYPTGYLKGMLHAAQRELADRAGRE